MKMVVSLILFGISILFNITCDIKIMFFFFLHCKSSAPKVESTNINVDFGNSVTTQKTIQYDSF